MARAAGVSGYKPNDYVANQYPKNQGKRERRVKESPWLAGCDIGCVYYGQGLGPPTIGLPQLISSLFTPGG
jgi:hypothetical protein